MCGIYSVEVDFSPPEILENNPLALAKIYVTDL